MAMKYPIAHTTEVNPVLPPSALAADDCFATDTGAAPKIGAITLVIAFASKNLPAAVS